ncbi:MAG TPA: sigma-54 dependent transcriptional regulator [Chitinophagaceae bacterium]|nr:sigma-54 dependent transcriptional regulator [Chitinophagaceae bacterium]
MPDVQSVKNKFGIIGNSPELNYAIKVAMQVSATELTVLIMGESGVGKEAFSQIIHTQSARKHNPFIAVNCGAIPEGTIDSELFGHEKGAFTGASDKRKGYFETVSGGTIFLDEIGEMPLGTQARLLRVLETGEYIKVGASKVQRTDVRVVAATNKKLLEQIQKGKFREDLYYRLSTVPIRVPALRERKEDISLLFRKFCADFADKYRTTPVRLTDDAIELLNAYSWPGNVRELKNVSEQISVLSKEKLIDSEGLKAYLPNHNKYLPVLAKAKAESGGDFGSEREILYKLFFDMRKDVTELKRMFFDVLQNPEMAGKVHEEYREHQQEDNGRYVPESSYYGEEENNRKALSTSHPIILNDEDMGQHEEIEESLTIADKEKELIQKALKKHRGKRKDAAIDLGISERTLYRKLKEYDING